MSENPGRWLIDVLLGVVLGVILALNVAIFAGTDDGYEASIGDIFEQRPVVGVIILVALVATPVGTVVYLRRRRLNARAGSTAAHSEGRL